MSDLNKSKIEIFIEKSKVIHGTKYDYYKSIYKSSHSKIIVTCPVHGDFFVRPCDHYGRLKQGCKVCSGSSLSNKKIDTEVFVKKSKEIHGDKYDYSKTKFEGTSKKLTITCRIHGDFEIRASDHYGERRGCPLCRKRNQVKRKNLTTESGK